MTTRRPRRVAVRERFGIAELFGRLIDDIPREERTRLLQFSTATSTANYPQCPFRLPDSRGNTACTKKGGVCSLRKYREEAGRAVRIDGDNGSLTVTCPFRFHEGRLAFEHIGGQVLGTASADDVLLAGEVGFLEPMRGTPVEPNDEVDEENVGKIDMIIVHRRTLEQDHLHWCAVEIQAVYFSGKGMESEFRAILNDEGDGLPFPSANRRPDYRSSGPKRLMPQLQIKIPSLRRWGKKMCVVVDHHFFRWISAMDEVNDISNSDIAWFVVGFDEDREAARARLVLRQLSLTTLEDAIEGLTGGQPVALSEFERKIRENVRNDTNS